MSIYIAIAISAIFDGLFSGFYIRTGIDANPSALGIKIIDMLSPYLPNTYDSQIEFFKFIILALPWVITIITILLAPHKILAVVIWAVVFAGVAMFIGYYDPAAGTLVINSANST